MWNLLIITISKLFKFIEFSRTSCSRTLRSFISGHTPRGYSWGEKPDVSNQPIIPNQNQVCRVIFFGQVEGGSRVLRFFEGESLVLTSVGSIGLIHPRAPLEPNLTLFGPIFKYRNSQSLKHGGSNCWIIVISTYSVYYFRNNNWSSKNITSIKICKEMLHTICLKSEKYNASNQPRIIECEYAPVPLRPPFGYFLLLQLKYFLRWPITTSWLTAIDSRHKFKPKRISNWFRRRCWYFKI